MKKLIIIATSLIIILSSATSCKSNTENSNAESSSVSAVKNEKTAKEVATEVSKAVGGGEVDNKIGQMIGATDGAYFTLNENDFEIYIFDNKEKLEEAKTGKFKLYEDLSLNSYVNNNYVLLYKTTDQKVVDAFKNIK